MRRVKRRAGVMQLSWILNPARLNVLKGRFANLALPRRTCRSPNFVLFLHSDGSAFYTLPP